MVSQEHIERTLVIFKPDAIQRGVVGDILVNVNNKPATSAIEVMDQVAEIRPGTSIPITVLRQGQRLNMTLTVSEYPAAQETPIN